MCKYLLKHKIVKYFTVDRIYAEVVRPRKYKGCGALLYVMYTS
jgi:hypothetical protein